MKLQMGKTGESSLCRMCRVENKTVSHIVSECKMLVQKEYQKWHDNLCRCIRWRLCEKHGFQRAQQWYEHELDRIIENKGYKILWDFMIQCDAKIEARRPGIIVIDKTKKEVKFIDVIIPGDVRVNGRKVGKIEKYKVLKDETTRKWGMKEVIVILVVVVALRVISSGFEKYISPIGIDMRVGHAQKTALLGTAKIMILVLGSKKKHHYKYHCARLCETFNNRLLSSLTESAGTTNNNALSILINNNNNNNNSNHKDINKLKQLKSKLH